MPEGFDPTLVTERLLATRQPHWELVLLHGWASSRECWRALLPALRPWANITLMDLPGLGGRGPLLEPEALADAILARAPQKAVYLGWSLGGQLATLLARRHPERVAALVTVASNPRFTADGDWPGVPPGQLAQLRDSYLAAPERTLRRFEALQALDLSGGTTLRRTLSACRGASPQGLERGLDWLAQFDTRAALGELQVPQLHLLGEADSLVPVALAPALEGLLAGRGRVRRLPGAGHALPLQAPEALARELRAFLDETVPPLPPSPARPGLSKADIAGSFSRAASGYDSVASLQRDVGERLLQRLEGIQGEVGTLLDLGCGTGYFQPALARRFPRANYIGLDIATGMLDYARRERCKAGCWVAGDAEQLPLAADSVDLVFSSLAIQWCQRPEALFAELGRVLRPGGVCVFSTLGPATLKELRSAWAAVDTHPHVNEFLPAAALEQASSGAGQAGLSLECERFCMYYGRVRELVDELKTLGAHNMNNGRQAGLGGRRALAGMVQAYERFREGGREAGRLPASYEVYFGHLEAV